MSKNLYIIAGPNGAGKTTASFTILPDVLDCKEFINADEIARGLSPFNPESVSIEAGKIMIKRIYELISRKESFAIETTLSSKSLISFVKESKKIGYKVYLLYFWLSNKKLAENRVKSRVESGGHNIPKDVIYRRYERGIVNLFDIYLDNVDELLIYNNSFGKIEIIAHKSKELKIYKENDYKKILKQYEEYK